MENKGYYQNRAQTLYPSLQEIANYIPTQGKPVIRRRMVFHNGDRFAFENKEVFRPALKATFDYAKEHTPKEILGTRNLFLVTKDSFDAKMAAVNLSALYVHSYLTMEGSWDRRFVNDTGNLSEEGRDLAVDMLPYLIDFSDYADSTADLAADNPYLEALDGQECMEVILFCGLLEDPGQLARQLEVIRVSPAAFRIIQITPKQLCAMEIRELLELYPEENRVLQLGEADLDYYCDVCDTLLLGKTVGLADRNDMKEMLLRMMRRSGCDFSEEWLGYYMDRDIGFSLE